MENTIQQTEADVFNNLSERCQKIIAQTKLILLEEEGNIDTHQNEKEGDVIDLLISCNAIEMRDIFNFTSKYETDIQIFLYECLVRTLEIFVLTDDYYMRNRN